jgi:hypothetical protein
MAKTATIVETFPKATVSRERVEAERRARLKAGSVSSEITEDKDNWILTSKDPVFGIERDNAKPAKKETSAKREAKPTKKKKTPGKKSG